MTTVGDNDELEHGGSEGGQGPDAEAGDQPKTVPLLALDSDALVSWFAGVLASRAWVDMGLLADPVTGEVHRKLDSARLAIDAYEALAKTLETRVGPAELRQMQAVLADLRLNFVRQAGRPDETVGDVPD